MRNGPQTLAFALDDANIDRFSEWLDETQAKLKVERQNRVRVRLMAEEVVLRLSEHFGADAEAETLVERHAGRTRLRLTVQGESHNVLAEVHSDMGDWSSSLGSTLGITPQYSYEGGRNVIRLRLPVPGVNPVLKFVRAIAVGTLVGVTMRAIAPTTVDHPIMVLQMEMVTQARRYALLNHERLRRPMDA